MCAPDNNVHIPKKIHVGGNSRIPWGLALVALHLGAIATNLIHPLSVSATGTLTVHSWFLGWFIGYKQHGLSCRWVRFDAALLIAASFQLCVGAFAFSRFYYGPLLGHSQDLFQGLSAVYISEEKWIPKAFVEWWLESSGSRFTGLAWYICEAADIATHQAPFVYMCHILSRENGEGWSAVTGSMANGVWPLSILAGPLHRLIWDYCTCGETFCDGPYRGFLKRIQNHEQFCWHTIPCIALVVFLLFERHYTGKNRNLVSERNTMVNTESGHHPILKPNVRCG